jgi:hypothetical protein
MQSQQHRELQRELKAAQRERANEHFGEVIDKLKESGGAGQLPRHLYRRAKAEVLTALRRIR